MTLEELIKEAAATGRFNLTVWETDRGFQASFSRDKQSWRCATDADPVAAAKAALIEFRPAPDVDLFG
jgi:hypothetical protein